VTIFLDKFASYLRRATGRALLGTIVGNAPGFLLPFAIALRFHIGPLTDAYAFALGVATFASAIFVVVLQSNVLPILQRMKRFGRVAFVNRLRRITFASTAVATLLYAATASASIIYIDQQSHWTAQQHTVLVATTAAFAIFVIASATNSLLSAALNALDSFLAPAATQAIKAIIPLAAIGVIPRDASGLLIISGLVALGELLRTGFLYVQVRRSISVLPDLPAPDGYAAELPMWRTAGPHGLSMLVAAASPLIDRGVAASLPAGSVTLVDLGEKTFQVPLQILSTSLVLVAGTHWANMLTSDVSALRHHFRKTIVRGTMLCLALLVGMCAPLAVFGALAGSTFAGEPTIKVIVIITLLLAGLPGAFIISAGARLLASTRSTYLLPWFALCSFSTNLIFDIIGAHWLGVQGIALSSTIYRCVNAVLYLVVIGRLMNTDFHGLRLTWGRSRHALATSSTGGIPLASPAPGSAPSSHLHPNLSSGVPANPDSDSAG
jgi:peptidoglycan biosynthesis protein MviN/MurJ (putative lipid II flippase)